MNIFVTRDTNNIAVPWRADLAQLIPHAREFVFETERMLLIPNQHAEAKVARNIGVPVPAPILTRYDWPGRTPWDIQKTTAALLTESPRAYVLSTMGCVDADTEYLSPEGWRRIADYRSGAVAEYHPDNTTIAFVEPSQFVKLPCDEMLRFKTTRGVDQLLSPEHRVLYEGWTDGRAKVSSAAEIEAMYPTVGDRGIRFRTTFTVTGTSGLPLTDAQIRLQVAVNADGHQCHPNKVSVRLKRARKKARIVELLRDANVDYTTSRSGEGFTAYRFTAPQLKHCFETWWAASQHQLEIVADEAHHWDGSARKAEARGFSSFAKSSADFIQYAYSASGRRASLSFSERDRRGYVEREWRVHASAGNPLAGLVGVNEDGTRRQNVWREPSTDGFKYCFVVPSTFLLLRRNGCIFATGNTGKTNAAIWAADYLMRNAKTRRTLISAPLSTLTPVWESELFRMLPKAWVVVLHGSKDKRLKLLEQDAEWFIINHHGVALLQHELKAKGFGTVIIDEIASRGLRNKSTELWKAHANVLSAPTVQHAWGMTGSPTPKAPTDAWAQVRLLTPDRVPRSLTRFKDMTMHQVSTFKWVKKPNAQDVVFAAMQPSVRFTREDVAELPPTTYQTREVKLGADAAKAYKLLFDKMRLLTHNGESITAVNEGVLQTKLLQVACGFIYTDKKTVYSLPSKERLDALMETIEATDRKVIVFVPFIHALEGVAQHLKKEGESIAVVNGSTPVAQRNKTFRAFQEDEKPRILVAHPQCMAHGLTLTAANTIVWYSPTNDYEIYEQANARITRPGQTSKTLILHLVGTTVEKLAYKRLQERGTFQGMLLELFKNQELDF